MAESKTLNLFSETSFSAQFRRNLENKYRISWLEDLVPPMMRTIFQSIAEMLLSKRNKEAGKNAFKICDFKGNFIIAGILSYHQATEEGEKGNWNLELTAYPDDIKGMIVDDNFNSEYITTIYNIFQANTNRKFKSPDFMHQVVSEAILTLIEFVKSNVPRDGSVYSVEIPDYVEVASAIENDEIVISITPGAIIKQAIKDDVVV